LGDISSFHSQSPGGVGTRSAASSCELVRTEKTTPVGSASVAPRPACPALAGASSDVAPAASACACDGSTSGRRGIGLSHVDGKV
jgi:hypothetical protein